MSPREAKKPLSHYPFDNSASDAILPHHEHKDFPTCILKLLTFLLADCPLKSNLRNQVKCCGLDAVITSLLSSCSTLTFSRGTHHPLLYAIAICLYYIPSYKIALSSSRAITISHSSGVPTALSTEPHPWEALQLNFFFFFLSKWIRLAMVIPTHKIWGWKLFLKKHVHILGNLIVSIIITWFVPNLKKELYIFMQQVGCVV